MNAVSNTEVEWQLRIPLDSIRVDPAVQQRAAGTSQDVVDEYVEAMRNGVEFPPIDVFSDDGGTFHLANGFHRWEARGLAFPDVKEIECRVHPGNRDDATPLRLRCERTARTAAQPRGQVEGRHDAHSERAMVGME